MNKKYLLFAMVFLISIFSISLIKADALNFPFNQTTDFKVYCFDVNSSICSSSTSCNISVYYPNNEILINNQNMTNNIAYFNYTLNNLTVLGTYSGVISCEASNDKGYSVFTFEVVPEIDITSTRLYLSLGFIGLIISLIIVCILVGYRIEASSEDLERWSYKILWFGIAYVLLIWLFHILDIFCTRTLYLVFFTSFFRFWFFLLLYSAFPLAIFLIIMVILFLLQNKRWQKEAIRGLR